MPTSLAEATESSSVPPAARALLAALAGECDLDRAIVSYLDDALDDVSRRRGGVWLVGAPIARPRPLTGAQGARGSAWRRRRPRRRAGV